MVVCLNRSLASLAINRAAKLYGSKPKKPLDRPTAHACTSPSLLPSLKRGVTRLKIMEQVDDEVVSQMCLRPSFAAFLLSDFFTYNDLKHKSIIKYHLVHEKAW